MIWPFKKKPDSQARSFINQPLPFKNGQAFFEYQCKYGYTEIVPEKGIVAIVVNISRHKDDRIQNGFIKVASADGGFGVFSQTPTAMGNDLQKDDIVIWVPLRQEASLSMIANATEDSRSNWLGFIMAKVAPEINPISNEFRALDKFH